MEYHEDDRHECIPKWMVPILVILTIGLMIGLWIKSFFCARG